MLEWSHSGILPVLIKDNIFEKSDETETTGLGLNKLETAPGKPIKNNQENG